MDKVIPRVPRGMRDILPDKMILRQYVIGLIQDVFEEFGFEPLQTPAIELEETLLGKYGPDAERLIYNANHSGGREKLSLRYDLSVPLSRVVAQYPGLVKPFKRYQIAPVWRAERPQKGRYREFYQCDADTVGSSSMLADAEILNMIYEILRRLGFQQFVTYINNRKIINGIGQFAGVPDELLPGLYRSIDKLDKVGLDGVRTELRRAGLDDAWQLLRSARVPDATLDDVLGLLRSGDTAEVEPLLSQAGLPAKAVARLAEQMAGLDLAGRALIPDDVVERLLEFLQIGGSNRQILAQLRERLSDYAEALEGIGELEEIIGYLEALDIPQGCYQIAPSMVRGLDYYTGPIYETVVEEPKIGSITGGGRYDELIGMFMDASPGSGQRAGYPATGTTIGIERIIDVMDELGMFPPDVGKTVAQVLVAQFDPALTAEALIVARDLRQGGLNTELYFENDPLGDQIRYALRKGIPFVAIVGPDEVKAGQVTLRNLSLRQQQTVAREQAAAQIRGWQGTGVV